MMRSENQREMGKKSLASHWKKQNADSSVEMVGAVIIQGVNSSMIIVDLAVMKSHKDNNNNHNKIDQSNGRYYNNTNNNSNRSNKSVKNKNNDIN